VAEEGPGLQGQKAEMAQSHRTTISFDLKLSLCLSRRNNKNPVYTNLTSGLV